MKKFSVLSTVVVCTMLLAACAPGAAPATTAPTAVPAVPTATTAPAAPTIAPAEPTTAAPTAAAAPTATSVPAATATSAAPVAVATIPPDKLSQKDHLLICSDFPYPPQEFFDENGDPAHVDGLGIGRSDHTVQLTLNDRVAITQKPVSLWSIFGHGRRWMRLPAPLLLPSGSRLTALVTPVQLPSTATSRWLGHLTFAGARIYAGGAQ